MDHQTIPGLFHNSSQNIRGIHHIVLDHHLQFFERIEHCPQHGLSDGHLKDEPNNKYCYGGKCMVANQNANDAAALSQKTIGWMIKWWWQATQLAGYKAGGWMLNWYFTKTGGYAKPMAKDDSDSLMSFIKWLLFGAFTQFSLLLMFFLPFLISIPGYVQGLFSFSTYTSLIPNAVFRWGWSFLLFLLYSLVTFWLGWVSFFPSCMNAFICCICFSIKPINDNADDFKNEFSESNEVSYHRICHHGSHRCICSIAVRSGLGHHGNRDFSVIVSEKKSSADANADAD
jgi:hypothetical protein